MDAVSTTVRNAASAVWRLVDGSEGLLGVKDPEIDQWRDHLLGGLHQVLIKGGTLGILWSYQQVKLWSI